jgi:hypothetical protein
MVTADRVPKLQTYGRLGGKFYQGLALSDSGTTGLTDLQTSVVEPGSPRRVAGLGPGPWPGLVRSSTVVW